jgi:hypothetical protein
MKKKTQKQNKEISMDELAIMVQTGFSETKNNLDDFRNEVNERFETVDSQFEEVSRRFDIVENKLITRHDREIEQLRDKMLRIETALMKAGKL